MSRHDRNNVEHLDLPDPELTNANYYISDGTFMSREEYAALATTSLDAQPKICAKEVQSKRTEVNRYFILCNNRNQMFDPRETDGRYKIRNVWKFRPVSFSTFDTYRKFLKTRYTSLLSQAERGL